jgi:hypothetical protein
MATIIARCISSVSLKGSPPAACEGDFFDNSVKLERFPMNEHRRGNRGRAENHKATETSMHPPIEAIIAMLSYLEFEILAHNPMAAYFLTRCRSLLLEPALNNPNPSTKQ